MTAARISLDRMVNAVEKVRQRLIRATTVLERAGLLYVVVGGNAVAAWVSSVDETAVRNTQDVNILIRREDFDAVKRAMEGVGFIFRHVAGIDLFLDGPDAGPRTAVHIVYANEKVRDHETVANPDVAAGCQARDFKVLALEPLVRIKLTAFRDKDRVHLHDLIGVKLVDGTWLRRLPADLRERLQSLLDTPEG